MRPETIWLLVGPTRECTDYALGKGYRRKEWRTITDAYQLRGLEGPLKNHKSPFKIKFMRTPYYANNFREIWAMARNRGFIA